MMTGLPFRLILERMKEAATTQSESVKSRRSTSRNRNPRGRRSPIHVGLGVLAVLAIAAITLLVPYGSRSYAAALCLSRL